MLVQIGTPSPGVGAAHIQPGQALTLSGKTLRVTPRGVSMDTKCSQIDSGEGASDPAFDMGTVLSPGVILLKHAKDLLVFKHNSDNLHSKLSRDSQKPGFSTILIDF